MQSTPTLKDTDPHDVFAIESLLHAHAEKAPPLAHDPAAPPAAPQVHVVPPISVDAPTSQVEPTFRAPDMRDIPVESVGLSEIKVDGLKPIGERPTPKWVEARGYGAIGPLRRHGRRRLAALWRSRQGDGHRVGAALCAGCIVHLGHACRRRATKRVCRSGRRSRSGRGTTGGDDASSARTRRRCSRSCCGRSLFGTGASCNRWRRISPRWASRSRN